MIYKAVTKFYCVEHPSEHPQLLKDVASTSGLKPGQDH